MTLPAAGFFPDPQDARRLRWWDGRTWGSATQPAPSAARSAEVGTLEVHAEPQFSVRPASASSAAWACGSGVATATSTDQGTRQVLAVRWFCLFGWGSLATAVVSAVVNPLGMLSVLAIVLAVVGIARPNGTGSWRVVGRSMAVSAIVLAATTGLVFTTAFSHVLHQYTGF